MTTTRGTRPVGAGRVPRGLITIAGIIVLLAIVKGHPGAWYFARGCS
jgi:hypothetical protein